MLSEKVKEVLRAMCDNTCQNCGKTQLQLNDKLQIHRIKRGYLGGKYVPNNILVICKNCHKKIHQMEFNG